VLFQTDYTIYTLPIFDIGIGQYSIFNAIKQIAGMKTVQSAPTINKANGSPCDSPDEILQCLREHFEAALNHLPGTHSAELDVEQIDATTDPDISVDEPSLDEVTCAIRKLRNGRAAGPDGIPPELFKYAINPISKALHEIFIQVWRTGHVPSDWKDGILIALYKGKGPKVHCSSYRPITLLSVPGSLCPRPLGPYLAAH